MPARAIWKGAISFGMVVIPIKLYHATDSKDIAFTTLHRACKTRLKQKRFCPQCEVDVEAADILRAYEVSKDQYVVLEEADFEDLPVASTRTIEITDFVELASIDPVYYEKSYVLEPEDVGVKPYYLLKQALETSGLVAVAKVSLRQKEHLCLLRPRDHGIALETMYYPDEIRSTAELKLPEDEVAIGPQEIKMAQALIDQLAGPFEPEKYKDEYRLALERVIEAKLGAVEPIAAAPAAPKGKVLDLVEALKASLEKAKKERPAVQPMASPQVAKKRARKAV